MSHRNSDNLHNAVFIGYSWVERTPYCGLTSCVAMVTNSEHKVPWLDGQLTQVEIWKEAAAELNVGGEETIEELGAT